MGRCRIATKEWEKPIVLLRVLLKTCKIDKCNVFRRLDYTRHICEVILVRLLPSEDRKYSAENRLLSVNPRENGGSWRQGTSLFSPESPRSDVCAVKRCSCGAFQWGKNSLLFCREGNNPIDGRMGATDGENRLFLWKYASRKSKPIKRVSSNLPPHVQPFPLHLRNKSLVGIQAGQKVSTSAGSLPVDAQVPASHEKDHVVHRVSPSVQGRVSRRILGGISHCSTREPRDLVVGLSA